MPEYVGEIEIDLEIEIYLNILSRFGYTGKPALRLQKIITDPNHMKFISMAALTETSFPARITLKKNKWNAANRLVALDILDSNDLTQIF